jgi:hypothetical protein
MISAVLSDDSVRQLREAAPPQYKTVFIHHVTLAFNPDMATYLKVREFAPNGEAVKIQCKENIWNDGVQAVTVEVFSPKGDNKVFVANKHPHVTISTDGKPPKESNTMLDGQSVIPRDQKENVKFLTLYGKVVYDE